MRVSTRIVLGFAVLMALSLAALSYQVRVIQQMQGINEELERINFPAASTLDEMVVGAEDIGEFSQKSLLDPDTYSSLLETSADKFGDHLDEVSKTLREGEAPNEMKDLKEAWALYNLQMNRARMLHPEPLQEGEEYPPELTEALNRLQSKTEAAKKAVQPSIEVQVRKAANLGATAARVSLFIGLFAVLLSAVVAFLIVRAISNPLRELTRGTRMISRGQFSHRLPNKGTDEFAELASDFNLMSERLGELDQMKKDFVSHVSHELKAPLASIRQTFHLLLEQIPGPLNDRQRKLLRLSQGSAERLAAMVSNLLDVSRIEAGAMEYGRASLDLVGLTRTVAEEFELQTGDKRVRIVVEANDPTITLECDRDRIIQVIGNLFDNALKFSPEDSKIVARVARIESNGSRLIRVSVADAGPGVSDSQKRDIFLKFHQASHGKKSGEGVGLGLAICKSIIEAHSGRIWVENGPHGGSVFSFELPATIAVAETKEVKEATCG